MSPPLVPRALAAILCCGAGCAASSIEARLPPAHPFDAVVVPGCPTLDDGSLSGCQKERAAWAAVIWRRGYARSFITSGAAVHSPWVEAEALAAAMTALGIPAEKILLEPEALHTDENMYNSARIARALGMRRLAVASQKGAAAWSCAMMVDWGQPCLAISVDPLEIQRDLASIEARLATVRTPRVPDGQFVELDERERLRAAKTGRSRRPPSFIVYPAIGILRATGSPWIPHTNGAPTRIQTWAERLVELSAVGKR